MKKFFAPVISTFFIRTFLLCQIFFYAFANAAPTHEASIAKFPLDVGNHWVAAYTGLPPTADVRKMQLRGTRLFAVVWPLGLYHSDNQGVTWTTDSTELSKAHTYNLAQNNQYLFAATVDSGV